MKRKQFSEEQIAFALRQAESGTPVKEVIRKLSDFRANLLSLEAQVWGFGCGRGP
jgi:putative transposase